MTSPSLPGVRVFTVKMLASNFSVQAAFHRENVGIDLDVPRWRRRAMPSGSG